MKGRLSKADLAYLAGYLDADGCITIARNNSPGRTNVTPTYWLRVQWSSVNKGLMDWIASKIRPDSPAKITQRHTVNGRYYYDVYIQNDTAAGILAKLLPYLRVKHGQAISAMEFRSYMNSTKKSQIHGRGHRKPWFQTAVLALFKQRISHLNSLNQGELVAKGERF